MWTTVVNLEPLAVVQTQPTMIRPFLRPARYAPAFAYLPGTKLHVGMILWVFEFEVPDAVRAH